LALIKNKAEDQGSPQGWWNEKYDATPVYDRRIPSAASRHVSGECGG